MSSISKDNCLTILREKYPSLYHELRTRQLEYTKIIKELSEENNILRAYIKNNIVPNHTPINSYAFTQSSSHQAKSLSPPILRHNNKQVNNFHPLLNKRPILRQHNHLNHFDSRYNGVHSVNNNHFLNFTPLNMKHNGYGYIRPTTHYQNNSSSQNSIKLVNNIPIKSQKTINQQKSREIQKQNTFNLRIEQNVILAENQPSNTGISMKKYVQNFENQLLEEIQQSPHKIKPLVNLDDLYNRYTIKSPHSLKEEFKPQLQQNIKSLKNDKKMFVKEQSNKQIRYQEVNEIVEKQALDSFDNEKSPRNLYLSNNISSISSNNHSKMVGSMAYKLQYRNMGSKKQLSQNNMFKEQFEKSQKKIKINNKIYL